MQERPENFNPAGRDPEATLVTPRFDERDARRAHPVVPLAEVPPRNASHTRHVRGPRRAWTPALLAVALLAVAALGGAVATKFMRSPRAEQAPEQSQAAPVQTAEAPPPQPSTPAVAAAPREGTPAASPPPRSGRTRRARAAAAALAVAGSERDEAEDEEDEERPDARAERRRAREDELEKELRKAVKRAKGKAPRLVDVITNP